MSSFLDCPAEQRVLQENILPFICADRRKMLRNKHVRGDLSPHMRSTFQGRDWMGGSVAFLSSPPFQVAACKGLELPEEEKSLLLIFIFCYWEEWNETRKIVYESCRSGFDFFFFRKFQELSFLCSAPCWQQSAWTWRPRRWQTNSSTVAVNRIQVSGAGLGSVSTKTTAVGLVGVFIPGSWELMFSVHSDRTNAHLHETFNDFFALTFVRKHLSWARVQNAILEDRVQEEGFCPFFFSFFFVVPLRVGDTRSSAGKCKSCSGSQTQLLVQPWTFDLSVDKAT